MRKVSETIAVTQDPDAVKIEGLLEGVGVRTVVLKGDECYSSCALMFMGGGSFEDRLVPMRTLEIGARLGFHAPYSIMSQGSYSAGEMNASYYIGLQLVARMISMAQYAIPNTMMIEILITPPDKLYMIDSSAKANSLKIHLEGVGFVEWTRQNLFNAWATLNGWDKPDDYFDPGVTFRLPAGGTELRWGGYGEEASGYCIARVSKDMKRAFAVPTWYDGDPEIRDVDLQPLKESDAFVGGRASAASAAKAEESS